MLGHGLFTYVPHHDEMVGTIHQKIILGWRLESAALVGFHRCHHVWLLSPGNFSADFLSTLPIYLTTRNPMMLVTGVVLLYTRRGKNLFYSPDISASCPSVSHIGDAALVCRCSLSTICSQQPCCTVPQPSPRPCGAGTARRRDGTPTLGAFSSVWAYPTRSVRLIT